LATCSSYFVRDTFVIKATTSEIILLSKFLAEIQTQFKVTFVGQIYHNKDTKEYFAYVHVLNSDVAEKLQNVSYMPDCAIEVDRLGRS
jgi:hypothetical protein